MSGLQEHGERRTPWTRRTPFTRRTPSTRRTPGTAGAGWTLVGLAGNPLGTFERIGRRADGAVVRVDLGLFRPYLVTRPEHVQHVLRDHAVNYPREGMMWKPMRRLLGNGIAGEDAGWARHRQLVQPVFSARNVASLVDAVAEVVASAGGGLDGTGRPVDGYQLMTRIVHRVIRRIFFGDRISAAGADRLGQPRARMFGLVLPRQLFPCF